jgi:hypothetical protein
LKSAILFVLSFALCYWQGRKALWRGVAALMAVGYFYGIIRANIPASLSYFIFDAGAVAVYLSLLSHPLNHAQRVRLRPVMPWFLCLAGWPLLLFLIPIQDPLVQLVGLRGAVFFLPFILIGAMLDNDDWYRLAWVFAGLNLAAFLFALAEAHFGVPQFYPRNAVTEIIYRSVDSAGGVLVYRIPSVFTSSAAYAGMMVGTVPFFAGVLGMKGRQPLVRNIFLVSLGITAVGVFLAASRTQAVFLILLVGAVTFSGRLRRLPWGGWIAVLGTVALLVATIPRLQRFVTLSDSSYVKSRIQGSANDNFFSLMLEYPMGNGLGGGGTHMPHFLQDRVRNPIQMENEYALLMLEEGVPGLLLWVSFLLWIITRPAPREREQWYLARWLARFLCLVSFATAVLGTGTLTSIPGTGLLLMYCGWIAAPQPKPVFSPIVRYRSYAQGARAMLEA